MFKPAVFVVLSLLDGKNCITYNTESSQCLLGKDQRLGS